MSTEGMETPEEMVGRLCEGSRHWTLCVEMTDAVRRRDEAWAKASAARVTEADVRAHAALVREHDLRQRHAEEVQAVYDRAIAAQADADALRALLRDVARAVLLKESRGAAVAGWTTDLMDRIDAALPPRRVAVPEKKP